MTHYSKSIHNLLTTLYPFPTILQLFFHRLMSWMIQVATVLESNIPHFYTQAKMGLKMGLELEVVLLQKLNDQ